jgi:hypothetical protein
MENTKIDLGELDKQWWKPMSKTPVLSYGHQVTKIYCGIRKYNVIRRTVVRTVVMYGLAVWTLSRGDENMLRTWKRKILRRVFAPVKENGVWRIGTN